MSPRRHHIRPFDGDPRHGTVNGYSNLRCRCQPCRVAWAADVKRRREERWALTAANGGIAPGPRKHGSASTYHNWGCQCRPCLDAHNAQVVPRIRNRRSQLREDLARTP